MGRTNKAVETALSVANEKLKSTQNQKLQVQLIGMIFHHHEAEMAYAAKKYVARNGNTGRKSKNKQLPASPPGVNLITPHLGENKDVSDLRAQLKNQEQAVKDLRQEVTSAKKKAENDRKQINDLQLRLDFTNSFAERLANDLAPQRRADYASELFHKFKSVEPNHLRKLFESLGLNLKTCQSWDSHYGDNKKLIVERLISPGKHELGEDTFLRLKLVELGIDLDAIKAVHDYRYARIGLEELKERTRSHITFDGDRPIQNTIPDDLMPRITEESLRDATAVLNNAKDSVKKLQWLEVIEKLLKPESPRIASLLIMETQATRFAI